MLNSFFSIKATNFAFSLYKLYNEEQYYGCQEKMPALQNAAVTGRFAPPKHLLNVTGEPPIQYYEAHRRSAYKYHK